MRKGVSPAVAVIAIVILVVIVVIVFVKVFYKPPVDFAQAQKTRDARMGAAMKMKKGGRGGFGGVMPGTMLPGQ